MEMYCSILFVKRCGNCIMFFFLYKLPSCYKTKTKFSHGLKMMLFIKVIIKGENISYNFRPRIIIRGWRLLPVSKYILRRDVRNFFAKEDESCAWNDLVTPNLYGNVSTDGDRQKIAFVKTHWTAADTFLLNLGSWLKFKNHLVTVFFSFDW